MRTRVLARRRLERARPARSRQAHFERIAAVQAALDAEERPDVATLCQSLSVREIRLAAGAID